MKRLVTILILAGIMIFFSGCTPSGISQEFLDASEVQLEYHGSVVHRFDPNFCQMAFNRDRCEFRVGTDNMSDFFVVRMEKLPAAEDEELRATVTWTTYSSVMTKKNITLKVVKLEGDKVWMWNSEHKLGVTVEYLY